MEAVGLLLLTSPGALAQDDSDPTLPEVVVEPEDGHLGAGPEFVRLVDPARHPPTMQLGAHLLQVWTDTLLLFLQCGAFADQTFAFEGRFQGPWIANT